MGCERETMVMSWATWWSVSQHAKLHTARLRDFLSITHTIESNLGTRDLSHVYRLYGLKL
jgi:hypothetical protein